MDSLRHRFGVPEDGAGYTGGLDEAIAELLNTRERESLDIQAAYLKAQGHDPDDPLEECISDLARSANRLANCTGGKINALTTHVKLWHYPKQRFLTAEELITLQGFDIGQLELGTPGEFSYSDLNSLAGNAWSVPTAASVRFAVIAGVFPTESGRPLLGLHHNPSPMAWSVWPGIKPGRNFLDNESEESDSA